MRARIAVVAGGLVVSFVGLLWSFLAFASLAPYYFLGDPRNYSPLSIRGLYVFIVPESTALFPTFLALLLMARGRLTRMPLLVIIISAIPFAIFTPVVPVYTYVPHCQWWFVSYESLSHYLTGAGLVFAPGPMCQ